MKSEPSPSRREMLRGTLAWTCALLLPSALIGCDSRPNAPSTDPGPTSPVQESTAPTSPTKESPAPSAEPGKVSQASVQYQAGPKGEQKCGDCLHFIAASGACKLVEGRIDATGWCTLWARKA